MNFFKFNQEFHLLKLCFRNQQPKTNFFIFKLLILLKMSMMYISVCWRQGVCGEKSGRILIINPWLLPALVIWKSWTSDFKLKFELKNPSLKDISQLTSVTSYYDVDTYFVSNFLKLFNLIRESYDLLRLITHESFLASDEIRRERLQAGLNYF